MSGLVRGANGGFLRGIGGGLMTSNVVAAAGALSSQFKLKNTSGSTYNSMPFDFFVPMAAGDLETGETVNVNDGSNNLTAEIAQVATDRAGNVRGGLVSAIGPATGFTNGAEVTLTVTAKVGTRATVSGKTKAQLLTLASDFDTVVEVDHEDTTTYTGEVRDYLNTGVVPASWVNSASKIVHERIYDSQVLVKEIVSGPVGAHAHLRLWAEVSFFSTDAFVADCSVRTQAFLTNGYWKKASGDNYLYNLTVKKGDAVPTTDHAFAGETLPASSTWATNTLTRGSGTWAANDIGKFAKNGTEAVQITAVSGANATTRTVRGSPTSDWASAEVFGIGHGYSGVTPAKDVWWNGDSVYECRPRLADIIAAGWTVPYDSSVGVTASGDVDTLWTAVNGDGDNPNREPCGTRSSSSGAARASHLEEAAALPGIQAMCIQDVDGSDFMSSNAYNLMIEEAALFCPNAGASSNPVACLIEENHGLLLDLTDVTEKAYRNTSNSTEPGGTMLVNWNMGPSHLDNPHFGSYMLRGDFRSIFMTHAQLQHGFVWNSDTSPSGGIDREILFRNSSNQFRAGAWTHRNMFMATLMTPDDMTGGLALQWDAAFLQTWADAQCTLGKFEMENSGYSTFTVSQGELMPAPPVKGLTNNPAEHKAYQILYYLTVATMAKRMGVTNTDFDAFIKVLAGALIEMNKTDLTTAQFEGMIGTDEWPWWNQNGAKISWADTVDLASGQAPSWAATTAYSIGDVVKVNTSGGSWYAYYCKTAGTSGGSTPTATANDNVSDGTVTWSVIAKANTYNQFYYTMQHGICQMLTYIGSDFNYNATKLVNALADCNTYVTVNRSITLPPDGTESGDAEKRLYYYRSKES